MKATSVKQIKFNRGQVSDLLSERVDMGLQNACGTVYDNFRINKYGQLQNDLSIISAYDSYLTGLVCLFDTGTDLVFPLVVRDGKMYVWSPLSKTNPYQKTTGALLGFEGVTVPDLGSKYIQFGYNVLFYSQDKKPVLINLTPAGASGSWNYVNLVVKNNYFDNAFDNIYVRGTNIETPSGFTVPTSGYYVIEGKQVTTKLIAQVSRLSGTGRDNGSDFTQDLVGQIIVSPGNGGVIQVRTVIDTDHLTGYILSPFIALETTSTDIRIPWDAKYDTKWVFGYEKPYGTIYVNGVATQSYPDSAIYVNQRLVFGGNDYHGNIISASRIGIINDFDPESATESDAFTTAIASKDLCRIVDFVVSNNELRIACTNGEYAMSLANLTPSGSLNGFDLRSEVGVSKDSAICDCGGLTAYISNDKTAVYGTQFNLLKDRYQPISLTSQTNNIVNNCYQLKYLINRQNSEPNCLVGVNPDSSMFTATIDINAGLVGATKLKNFKPLYHTTLVPFAGKLYQVGSALWGIYQNIFVRFTTGEMFDLPVWAKPSVTPTTFEIPSFYHSKITSTTHPFRALYKDGNEYKLISPTGYTQNQDLTYTINFADNIDQSKIVCAGFVRQADWRSVEIGVGMATREINKQIIKLEGVIEPTQITGAGAFAGLVLTPDEAKKFIKLTRSKDVETMDVDNLSNTSYTENQDMVWRRAFDNPSRELHYGVSAICPVLVKSLTAVVSYDEVN